MEVMVGWSFSAKVRRVAETLLGGSYEHQQLGDAQDAVRLRDSTLTASHGGQLIRGDT